MSNFDSHDVLGEDNRWSGRRSLLSGLSCVHRGDIDAFYQRNSGLLLPTAYRVRDCDDQLPRPGTRMAVAFHRVLPFRSGLSHSCHIRPRVAVLPDEERSAHTPQPPAVLKRLT